jgi:excisionase family DNA binding protein
MFMIAGMHMLVTMPEATGDEEAEACVHGQSLRTQGETMSTYRSLVDELEVVLRKAALLGELERLKYFLLTRMTSSEPVKINTAPLSVREVAKRLNISPSSVYELVRQKKLGSGQIGKHIRISEQKLTAYEVACGLKGIDKISIPMVQFRHVGTRTQESAKAVRPHPSPVSRGTPRDSHDSGQMGTQ